MAKPRTLRLSLSHGYSIPWLSMPSTSAPSPCVRSGLVMGTKALRRRLLRRERMEKTFRLLLLRMPLPLSLVPLQLN